MSSVESMSNRPPVLCCAVCCCMLLRSAWFNATRSVAACAEVCCNDWSCWGFAFYPKGKTGNNTAKWPKIDLHKHATPGHPKRIVDCANASQAAGMECKGDNLSPLGNFCDDPTPRCSPIHRTCSYPPPYRVPALASVVGSLPVTLSVAGTSTPPSSRRSTSTISSTPVIGKTGFLFQSYPIQDDRFAKTDSGQAKEMLREMLFLQVA